MRDHNAVTEMIQKSGRLCQDTEHSRGPPGAGGEGGLAYSRGLDGGSSEIFKMSPSLFFHLIVFCGLSSKGISILSQTPYDVKILKEGKDR